MVTSGQRTTSTRRRGDYKAPAYRHAVRARRSGAVPVTKSCLLVALAALPLLAYRAAPMPGPGPRLAYPEQQLATAVAATLQRNVHLRGPTVYPSPAYANAYLRDSFWTAQALGNRSFALRVLNAFATRERADGDPPTMFVNASPPHGPRYYDDESAALLLIWAWRNDALYGLTPPRATLRHALGYLLHRARGGYFIAPAGRYHGWWDAYPLPRPGALSYSQGLYAVALRAAQHLGLRVPPHALAAAEQAYRALYNRQLGYLCLSSSLCASDASALTGEFLSLWLFGHAMLSTAVVRSTLRHLVPFGAGFRVVALPRSGTRAAGYLAGSPRMGAPGDYQNGASWLLYDALSIGAAGLHGEPYALARLQSRLALEFRHGVVLHEYLRTNPRLRYFGAEPPYRDGFSWDAFALVVDRALHAYAARHHL
jgi:hypothetical protein